MRRRNHKKDVERTCLGCRDRDNKAAMLRLVVEKEKLVIDLNARKSGRGGYLHPRDECLQRFISSKGKECRSLKRAIPSQERRDLAKQIVELVGALASFQQQG